ncbi:MAG: hypothetical protein EZS28_004015, partial [Streblomastix strix]
MNTLPLPKLGQLQLNIPPALPTLQSIQQLFDQTLPKLTQFAQHTIRQQKQLREDQDKVFVKSIVNRFDKKDEGIILTIPCSNECKQPFFTTVSNTSYVEKKEYLQILNTAIKSEQLIDALETDPYSPLFRDGADQIRFLLHSVASALTLAKIKSKQGAQLASSTIQMNEYGYSDVDDRVGQQLRLRQKQPYVQSSPLAQHSSVEKPQQIKHEYYEGEHTPFDTEYDYAPDSDRMSVNNRSDQFSISLSISNSLLSFHNSIHFKEEINENELRQLGMHMLQKLITLAYDSDIESNSMEYIAAKIGECALSLGQIFVSLSPKGLAQLMNAVGERSKEAFISLGDQRHPFNQTAQKMITSLPSTITPSIQQTNILMNPSVQSPESVSVSMKLLQSPSDQSPAALNSQYTNQLQIHPSQRLTFDELINLYINSMKSVFPQQLLRLIGVIPQGCEPSKKGIGVQFGQGLINKLLIGQDKKKRINEQGINQIENIGNKGEKIQLQIPIQSHSSSSSSQTQPVGAFTAPNQIWEEPIRILLLIQASSEYSLLNQLLDRINFTQVIYEQQLAQQGNLLQITSKEGREKESQQKNTNQISSDLLQSFEKFIQAIIDNICLLYRFGFNMSIIPLDENGDQVNSQNQSPIEENKIQQQDQLNIESLGALTKKQETNHLSLTVNKYGYIVTNQHSLLYQRHLDLLYSILKLRGKVNKDIIKITVDYMFLLLISLEKGSSFQIHTQPGGFGGGQSLKQSTQPLSRSTSSINPIITSSSSSSYSSNLQHGQQSRLTHSAQPSFSTVKSLHVLRSIPADLIKLIISLCSEVAQNDYSFANKTLEILSDYLCALRWNTNQGQKQRDASLFTFLEYGVVNELVQSIRILATTPYMVTKELIVYQDEMIHFEDWDEPYRQNKEKEKEKEKDNKKDRKKLRRKESYSQIRKQKPYFGDDDQVVQRIFLVTDALSAALFPQRVKNVLYIQEKQDQQGKYGPQQQQSSSYQTSSNQKASNYRRPLGEVKIDSDILDIYVAFENTINEMLNMQISIPQSDNEQSMLKQDGSDLLNKEDQQNVFEISPQQKQIILSHIWLIYSEVVIGWFCRPSAASNDLVDEISLFDAVF